MSECLEGALVFPQGLDFSAVWALLSLPFSRFNREPRSWEIKLRNKGLCVPLGQGLGFYSDKESLRKVEMSI